MESVVNIEPACITGYTGVATVVEIEIGTSQALVKVEAVNGPIEFLAWLTHPLADQVVPGDDVIILSDQSGTFYGIAQLPRPMSAAGKNKISMSDGAYASLEKTPDGEKLCFFSKSNALMFQYDASNATARISTEAENISFQAPKGSIDFNAARNIRFTGEQIDLRGNSGIGISVGEVFDRLKSAFNLKPGQLQISGHRLRVSTKRTDFYAEEIRSHIKNFSSQIKNFRLTAEKLETVAGSIVEKAKNVYRSTENLSQHRAGRIRMLIDKSFHLNSKTAVLKSKEKVKVDAEKIHLG